MDKRDLVHRLLTSLASEKTLLDGAQLITMRLHVMQRTVLLSEFCLSVRPSVRQMRVL